MNSISLVRAGFCAVLTVLSTACSSDAERGRELAQQYQCGSCHIIPGVNGANGTVAVTLKSFGRRAYIAGHVPNNDQNLTRWIIDPPSLVPGTLMPKMGVTPGDAKVLTAYLMQLR